MSTYSLNLGTHPPQKTHSDEEAEVQYSRHYNFNIYKASLGKEEVERRCEAGTRSHVGGETSQPTTKGKAEGECEGEGEGEGEAECRYGG